MKRIERKLLKILGKRLKTVCALGIVLRWSCRGAGR
jgi:hypothetical protein